MAARRRASAWAAATAADTACPVARAVPGLLVTLVCILLALPAASAICPNVFFGTGVGTLLTDYNSGDGKGGPPARSLPLSMAQTAAFVPVPYFISRRL